MGDKVVAVLAVHNEEEMLPYTLNRIASQVDYVIAVLDGCSDNSAEIINSADNARCVTYNGFCVNHWWRNYRAETKAVGIKFARQMFGDCLLLMVDCDVLLDEDSVAQAKQILLCTGKDCVVFAYKQYSLNGSVVHRLKDEMLNLFGKLTKKLTRQPVVTGVYLIKSEKAFMGDVTSDYETLLPKLDTAWLQTCIKHLRPRYDGHTQKLMGLCRATLSTYNLRKILLYSVFTASPLVAAGFLTAKIRGTTTVENTSY